MKKVSFKYRKYLLKKSKNIRPKERCIKFNQVSINPKPKILHKDVPKIFKLNHENLEICEEVITYINSIKKIGKDTNIKRSIIYINMRGVSEIDEGAIAMLLSVMEELSKKIPFTGNKPTNQEARNILEKSGFFKYVTGKVDEKNKKTKNIILTGKDSEIEKLIEVIIQATETIWGEQGRNPPLYEIVSEMMYNSCNHAFKKKNQIKWHFALNHSESDNTVQFSFVDNGEGIIETLKNNGFIEKVKGKILRSLPNELDIKLLDFAFNNKGQYKSQTGDPRRGRGLVTIYENYMHENLKNLIVISNGVYIDFDKKIKHNLKTHFSGTYYYWKIDQTCKKQCFSL